LEGASARRADKGETIELRSGSLGIKPLPLRDSAANAQAMRGLYLSPQGEETMLRLILRFFSLCLLATAFITLIIDARRSYGAATLSVTPLSEFLTLFVPGKLALVQDFIDRHVHPMRAITAELLRLPVWFNFAVVGGIIAWLAKKPARKFGFSSR
jgi:hypothetical protein